MEALAEIGPQHTIPFQFVEPLMQGRLAVVHPGRIVSISLLVWLQNMVTFWTAVAAGVQQKFNSNIMHAHRHGLNSQSSSK